MRKWSAGLRDLARWLDPAGDDPTLESGAQAADIAPAGESTAEPTTEDSPPAGPPAHWLKDIAKRAPHLLDRFRVAKKERSMSPEESPLAGVSHDSTAADAAVNALPAEHTATPQTDGPSAGPSTSARRDPKELSTEQSNTIEQPRREPYGRIETGRPTKAHEPHHVDVADRATSHAGDNALPGEHTAAPEIDVLTPAETVPAQSNLTEPLPAESEQQTSQVAVENTVRSQRFPEPPGNQKGQIGRDSVHEGRQAGSTDVRPEIISENVHSSESETPTKSQPSDASSDLQARGQEEVSRPQSIKAEVARDTHDASAPSELPSAMIGRSPTPDSKSTSAASEKPEKEPSFGSRRHTITATREIPDTASTSSSREGGRAQAAVFPALWGTGAGRDAGPDWFSQSAGSARSAAKPMAMPGDSVADRWPELPEESSLDWYDALAAERIEVERRKKLELEQLGIPWNE